MLNKELKKLQETLYFMLVDLDKVLKENNIQYYLIGGSALGAVRHKGFIPWDDDIDIGIFRSDFERMEKIISKCNLKGMKYCKIGENIIQNAPIGYLYKIDSTSKDLSNIATIDIFPLDGVPKNEILKKVQKYFSMIYHLSISQLEAKNRGELIKIISKIILKLTPKKVFKIYQSISKKVITNWSEEKFNNCVNLFGQAKYDKEIMPKRYLGNPKYIKFEKGVFPVPELVHEYLTHLYGEYMILPKKEERVPKHKSL